MTAKRSRRLTHNPNEDGVSTVEFALVVPIVLMVLFGVIQYGYHYWSLETASATAREAARRLSVGDEWVCRRNATGNWQAVNWAEEATRQAAMPAIGPVSISPAATYDPTAADIGGNITVTIQFQSLDIGILPVPNGGVVRETATARVHNVPRTRPPAPTCPNP